MVMARGWEGDFMRFYTSLLRTICNFWKRPGKTEGKRRRGWQRRRWLDSMMVRNHHEFEQASGYSGGQVSLECVSP